MGMRRMNGLMNTAVDPQAPVGLKRPGPTLPIALTLSHADHSDGFGPAPEFSFP